MNTYVLGLDGGGTKTLAEATDINGKMLFRIHGGALNPNGESANVIISTLADIITHASKQANGMQLGAICIGAAGVSNPNAENIFKQGVAKAGFDGVLRITGDNYTALAGALGKPEGIILISGTGSICTGIYNGHEARSGGRGHLIDDEGSGYAMGRDVLRAVIEASDGRGSNTCLTEKVYAQLEVSDIGGIVSYVYTPMRPKSEIAAFARLLPQAVENNDEAARLVYHKAANELVRLACAVASKLQMTSGELAIAGSALLNDKYLQNLFITQMLKNCPNIQVVLPKNDAAYGAALLARELLLNQ